MKFRMLLNAPSVLAAAGIPLLVAGFSYFQTNTSRLDIAAQNLARCEQLAAEIAYVRQGPQRAQLTSRSADDQGTAVERAAAAAHIARDSIVRIDPQPAKRLGKSDYLEQATEVELLAVSLRQSLDLMFNLTNGETDVAINTLRLRMPHEADQAGHELWLADVVLTQRIYTPTTARKE